MNHYDLLESSAFDLELTFRDADNAIEVPTNIWYQIYCNTSKVQIRADTEVTPAASTVTISFTPTDTALQDQENEIETRTILITTDKGLDTQFYKLVVVDVINLRAIT